MKHYILFLALLASVVGQIEADTKYFTATPTSAIYSLDTTMAYSMAFSCGITISMETGEVKIPEALTLDAASRGFWKDIERAFPHAVRRRIPDEDAEDATKAIKILLEHADPETTAVVTVNAVMITEPESAKAQRYADKLKKRENDIAWARSVLAKREAQTK